MTFTIPNSSQTFNAKQAQVDMGDISIFGAGLNAYGLVSGCLPTATTSNLIVSVASGVVLSGGCKVVVGSGTVTLTSGDPTNPRFDLVLVSTSGAISVTNGTASSTPSFPGIVSTSMVALFAVYMPAAASVVSSSQIVDKRLLIAEWDANQPAGRFRNSTASTVYYCIPGVFLTSQTTITVTAGRDNMFPFQVVATITVDQIAMSFGVASTLGGLIRMGLYKADTDWQPAALVTDSGDLSASSAGLHTFTPTTPLVLPPGRYLTVFNPNNSTMQLEAAIVSSPMQPISDALGTTIFISALQVVRAYAAFPDPGTKWTSGVAQALPFFHPVWLRVSTA